MFVTDSTVAGSGNFGATVPGADQIQFQSIVMARSGKLVKNRHIPQRAYKGNLDLYG
jgi:hypothetical protein